MLEFGSNFLIPASIIKKAHEKLGNNPFSRKEKAMFRVVVAVVFLAAAVFVMWDNAEAGELEELGVTIHPRYVPNGNRLFVLSIELHNPNTETVGFRSSVTISGKGWNETSHEAEVMLYVPGEGLFSREDTPRIIPWFPSVSQKTHTGTGLSPNLLFVWGGHISQGARTTLSIPLQSGTEAGTYNDFLSVEVWDSTGVNRWFYRPLRLFEYEPREFSAK